MKNSQVTEMIRNNKVPDVGERLIILLKHACAQLEGVGRGLFDLDQHEESTGKVTLVLIECLQREAVFVATAYVKIGRERNIELLWRITETRELRSSCIFRKVPVSTRAVRSDEPTVPRLF
jgi:hypothetical protein